MADLSLEVIKKYFSDHKDDEAVKTYLSGLGSGTKIDAASVNEFLETDEGKKLITPKIDQAVSRAIDTYKEKTLPGLVKEKAEELIKKKNPDETPEQKQIREQNERIEALEKGNKIGKLKDLTYTQLTADKLSEFTAIADLFLADDEETTKGRIVQFKSILDAYVEKRVKDAIPTRDVTGPAKIDPSDPGFKNPWSPKYLNYTEQGRIVRDDPKLAEKLRMEAEKASK